MLEARPEDRPTPAKLLQHAYFRDLNIDEVRAGRVPRKSACPCRLRYKCSRSSLPSDNYQPQFFGRLDKATQDISFRTWQRQQAREHAPPPSQPIGPLPEFTWPDVPQKEAWDIPSPQDIRDWY